MTTVAIIPARGGSKRLPGKNIKLLGDKPLIAWTIEAALNSGCFDRVIVSTDADDIAAIAIEYGADVPFLRPANLSADTSTSDMVVQHTVDWLEQHEKLSISTIALLQPTSPFRNSCHIIEALDLMHMKGADGIVSVTESDVHFELCNTLPRDHNLSNFINSRELFFRKRTQDMEPIYQLNGAIYLLKRHLVGNISQLYAADSKGYAYIMRKEDSIDIDTRMDFDWAEFCLLRKIY